MATATAPSSVQVRDNESVLLHGVRWSTYEALLEDMGDRHIRLTYDNGDLEIMTLSGRHERSKSFIRRMIDAITEELNIPIASGGSTTFKKELQLKGLEPDECYWVANELAVRGRTDFDFDFDPPPDIAVEVEISASVLNRLGIYAALRVSEVWRSDGQQVLIEQLQNDGTYALVDHSPSFPWLPLAELGRFLEASRTMDETSWIRSFRAWVRTELAPGFATLEMGNVSLDPPHRCLIVVLAGLDEFHEPAHLFFDGREHGRVRPQALQVYDFLANPDFPSGNGGRGDQHDESHTGAAGGDDRCHDRAFTVAEQADSIRVDFRATTQEFEGCLRVAGEISDGRIIDRWPGGLTDAPFIHAQDGDATSRQGFGDHPETWGAGNQLVARVGTIALDQEDRRVWTLSRWNGQGSRQANRRIGRINRYLDFSEAVLGAGACAYVVTATKSNTPRTVHVGNARSSGTTTARFPMVTHIESSPCQIVRLVLSSHRTSGRELRQRAGEPRIRLRKTSRLEVERVPKKAKRELTELEGCVLGEIWDKGPCTPYAIRQEFLRSLNPYWSGSAGAIYPLVRRLEQQGFIRSTDHATGRKQSKRYVLTAAGKKELQRWLGPPLTAGTVGVPMDPLRNRLLYLQSLPADQQTLFLRSAEEGLRVYLEQLKGVGVERTQREGPLHMLVLQGAIAMMQARIEWLHTVIAGMK